MGQSATGTVPFDGVQWREHTGIDSPPAISPFENGRIHAPSGARMMPKQPAVNQLSQDWMAVESNPGRQLWING